MPAVKVGPLDAHELVAFTIDPTAVELGEDGEGPYVVMRKRKDDD